MHLDSLHAELLHEVIHVFGHRMLALFQLFLTGFDLLVEEVPEPFF